MASARILILDDDDLLRTIVTERLDRSGYDIVAARTVAEARACITRDPPDVALLDVKLPDGEGTELLPELNEAEVPVVMMTAHATVQLAVILALTAWVTWTVTGSALRPVARMRRELNMRDPQLRRYLRMLVDCGQAYFDGRVWRADE